jgi:hypothetical protein
MIRICAERLRPEIGFDLHCVAGPLTSHSPKGPNTATPFVIEVETAEGAAYLQIGPQASAVLAEELTIYLKRYASKV